MNNVLFQLQPAKKCKCAAYIWEPVQALIKYEGKSVNKSQKAMKKILSEIFT
jgi:hypothetical protein